MNARCDGLTFPTGEEVDGQEIPFKAEWWRRRGRSPAEWSDVLTRRTARDGYEALTRSDLFDFAEDGHDEGAVLLACFAWGVGKSAKGDGASNFNVGRRAQVFRKNDLAVLRDKLRAARLVLKAEGAVAAYASLLKGYGDNYIKYLGPAFFTKFLYVLDHASGNVGPRALILDENVAKAVRCCHDSDYPLSSWSPSQYAMWLEIADRVASEASISEGRTVRSDAVEMRYFLLGRDGS